MTHKILPEHKELVERLLSKKALGPRRNTPRAVFWYLASRSISDSQLSLRSHDEVARDFYGEHGLALARLERLDQALISSLTAKVKANSLSEADLSAPDLSSSVRSFLRVFIATPKARQKLFAVHKTRVRNALGVYYKTASGFDESVIFGLDQHNCVVWRRRQLHWSVFDATEQSAIGNTKLRQFLEQQSEAEGTTSADRDTKIRALAASSPEFSPGRKGWDAFFAADPKMSFRQMRQLAESIGIHPLMLDPLLSTEVSEGFLAIDLPVADSPDASNAKFVTLATATGEARARLAHSEAFYGSETQYGVPSQKLKGTDAAFVFLHLDGGGHSTAHHHPGDELLLVLSGAIRLVLHDSGTAIELHPHDYAQIYAEQNHSVENLSKTESAEVFIIRFLQIDVAQTRQAMRRELWASVRGRSKDSTKQLEGLTWGWVLATAADRSIKYQIPSAFDGGGRSSAPRLDRHELHNRFGLARLLRQSLQSDHSIGARPFSLQQERSFLAAAAKECKHIQAGERPVRYRGIDAWLWALESAQIRVPATFLPKIIRLFKLFDLLTCEFLFPGVPRHAVVRQDVEGDWVDMADVVREVPGLKPIPGFHDGAARLQQRGIRYTVPCRSLACSDVAVSVLRLEGGQSTVRNVHPGSELLLPTIGVATVEFGKAGAIKKSVGVGSVLHYASGRPHRITNLAQTPTQMLLVRFYGDVMTARGNAPTVLRSPSHVARTGVQGRLQKRKREPQRLR